MLLRLVGLGIFVVWITCAVVVCLRLLYVVILIVLLLCFLLMNLGLIDLAFGYGMYGGGFVALYWFMCLCLWLLYVTVCCCLVIWFYCFSLVGLLVCLMCGLVGWLRTILLSVGCFRLFALGFGWLVLVFVLCVGCLVCCVVWVLWCLVVLGFLDYGGCCG